MLQAFSPKNRLWTFIFLVAAALLALAAAVVGIDDNPLGLSLAVFSAASLVLMFTHSWRSSAQFRRLIYASLMGFAAFLAVGIALQAVIEFIGASRFVDTLLEVVSTALLLAAGFLCVPAGVVGAVGAVLMRTREIRQRRVVYR